jgi:putative phosphoribosyl transferase
MSTTFSTETILVPAGPVVLEGDLQLPAHPRGVVLFAHGSGSSRYSVRNRRVAEWLNAASLGTLLLDLLTLEEERVDARTAHLRFDIDLLADRLAYAARWLHADSRTGHLPIGCFGASTGGGAALVAAARAPELISSVISRGGRPDLAGEALRLVEAPTLLIVGGLDHVVIDLNRAAFGQLRCEKRLEIVPGATHLFEEPGTLEQVAELAEGWFIETLTDAAAD